VPRYVVEGNRPALAGDRLVGVDVRVPRDTLTGGMVLVDTVGIGGIGSVHATATLAALATADGVVFVTDAEGELTRPELDFLRQAREVCDAVVCVLTKTDFYPGWRGV